MEASVLDTLKNIEDLPTLPSVAMEVLGLSRQPDVSIKEISECIYRDPPLATNVMKMANSAFYRRGPNEIDTLHRAILMMGLNEIINITTSVTVMSILPSQEKGGDSIRKSFWQHCVATGLIARHIDKKLGIRSQGREFVGGLLHDIGKIILDEYFHDQFMEAHAISVKQDVPMHEAEMEVLGTTHMEIGNFLANRWNLPPYIADITLNHHHPEKAQFRDINALVGLSNLMAKAKEFSCGSDRMSFVLKDQEAWHVLKKMGYRVDMLDIERFTFEIENIGEEVRAYISTISESSDQEQTI